MDIVTINQISLAVIFVVIPVVLFVCHLKGWVVFSLAEAPKSHPDCEKCQQDRRNLNSM
jgi:hypothetical protein